jgi:putative isomerase
MLPDAIHDEGVVTYLDKPVEAEVTKPPLVAWTVQQLFESSGNVEFLDEVYDPLVRWNRWWFTQNDDDHDGLCQYNHPNSLGLDDSPLWDGGMPVESPDLNTYLSRQMNALAVIADKIGLRDEVQMWRARADQVVRRMIEQMRDKQAGVFWAQHAGQPIHVLTPISLYPLWTGRLSEPTTARLIDHLANPAEFWTSYPLAMVARTDPRYNPNETWRGPTWVNINCLFIEALARIGQVDLATQLRDRTLDLVLRQDDIFEYYNPTRVLHRPKLLRCSDGHRPCSSIWRLKLLGEHDFDPEPYR